MGKVVHEGVVAEESAMENKNRVGILDEGTISWDVVRKEDYVTVDGDDVLDVIDYLNDGGKDALYHEKRGDTSDEEDYDDDFGDEGKDKKEKGENDEDAEGDDYDYGDYDEEDGESEGDYDEGREDDYSNEVYDAEEERDQGKRDTEDYDEEDYNEDAREEEGIDGDLDDYYGEEDYDEQEESGENVANDDTDDYDDNEDYDGEEDYLRNENDGSDYGGKDEEARHSAGNDSTKEYDMEKADSAARQRQLPGRSRRNQSRDRTRDSDTREGSGLDEVDTQNARAESNRGSKLEHQDAEDTLEEKNKNDQSVHAPKHDKHATSDPIDDLPAKEEEFPLGIGAMRENASLGGDMVSTESTERDRKESRDSNSSDRSEEQGEHSFGRDAGWKRGNTKLISVADSTMQYTGDGKNNTRRVEDEEQWSMAHYRTDSRNGTGKATVSIADTDVIEDSGFKISSTGILDDPSLAENDPSKFPQKEGLEIVHIADKNKNTSIAGDERNREKYHMIVSVGDGVYTEWQARVVSLTLGQAY